MKRWFLVLMLVLMSPVVLSAQNSNNNSERERREDIWKEIESWKVAFFTHELCLTPDEAVNFWPLYNEMTQKLMNLDWQRRHLRHSIFEKESQCKEVDYIEILHKIMDLDKKRLETKHEYYNRIVKVLPVSKLLKLDDVEERFRQKLFDYLRKRTHNSHSPKKGK